MRTFQSDFDSVFGYDGPSPFEEKRMKARRDANPADCRDPDHTGCESCQENDDE